MNKEHIERTKRMIEVMQAYVDGEEIHAEDGYVPNPLWNWVRWDYRIAKTPDQINWDHVAPEFVAMERDSDGGTYLYTKNPKISSFYSRVSANGFSSYKRGTVDWKDSLVIRPGCE